MQNDNFILTLTIILYNIQLKEGDIMKKHIRADWLRNIVIFIGVISLLFLLVVIPSLGKYATLLNPDLHYIYYPCLIFIWITGVPFYFGLWNCLMICGEISNDNSFSMKNTTHLKNISKLALLECILYFIGSFILFTLNLLHPGILLITFVIIVMSIGISVGFRVLSHILEKAIDIQTENELTI